MKWGIKAGGIGKCVGQQGNFGGIHLQIRKSTKSSWLAPAGKQLVCKGKGTQRALKKRGKCQKPPVLISLRKEKPESSAAGMRGHKRKR
jgi:hypothetical protein